MKLKKKRSKRFKNEYTFKPKLNKRIPNFKKQQHRFQKQLRTARVAKEKTEYDYFRDF